MLNNDSHFRIADLTFEVKSAVLSAHWTSGQIRWSIRIDALPKSYCGEEWRPVASSEWLLAMDGRMCNQWVELFPYVIDWEASYNSTLQHDEALLHVFESCGIARAHLDIGAPDRGIIPISWIGVSDVFSDAKYSTNLPVDIKARCLFGGVEVGKLGEQISMTEALARVRPVFHTQLFELRLPQDQHDPPMMVPME